MNRIKKYFANLIDPQLLVVLLLLILTIIALTLIFSKKIPEYKKYKTNIYIYLFLIVIVYAMVAFLGYNKLFSEHLLYEFIFYQVFSLVIGSIHCYVYHNFFNKFEQEKSPMEYLFALLVALYGIIPFLLIYSFFNGNQFAYLMLGHYILFFVPTFVNDTFNRAMKIPPKVYLTWQFPENYRELAGVSDEEMRDLVVFTFLIGRKGNSKKLSIYRAKGPTRIDFGRLFFNFVLDYNERHPAEPIEIKDKNGKLYEWVFFKQPKWYETTQYIDPKYTLYMNGIEENSVIFCIRSEHMVDEKNALTSNDEDADFEYNKEKDNDRVNNF